MKALLLLLIWAARPAGAEVRDVEKSGWRMADPAGLSFDGKGAYDMGWSRTAGAGVETTLRLGASRREHPMKADECEDPRETHEFDDAHPLFKTLIFTCGDRVLHYVIQTGIEHSRDKDLFPDMAVTVHFTYKSFKDPLRPGHLAAIRAALKGLSPSTGVSLGSRQAAPAGPAAGKPPPKTGPKRGAPARTWTDAAVQVLAEGNEVVIKGSDAKLFGVNDPTPAKFLAHPIADSTDGIERTLYVAVRPGEGPEGLEATHLLLKAATGKGRSYQERYLRAGMNGQLQGAASGPKGPRRLKPSDPVAVTWFEREAEFYLKGEHRVRP